MTEQKQTWVVMRSRADVVVVDPKINPEKCKLENEFYAGYSFDDTSQELAIWNAAKSEDDDLPELLETAAALLAEDEPHPETRSYKLIKKIQERLKIYDGRKLNLPDYDDES